MDANSSIKGEISDMLVTQQGALARILVVDSEPMNALTLSAILEKVGYNVATAFTGEQAILTAATFAPGLLLTEVCMHGITGIETASQVTAILPHCKVLFLSGEASASSLLDTAPAGLVHSFARKPIHPLDLLNSIAYMLSKVSAPRAAENCSMNPSSIARMLASAGFLTSEAPRSGTANRRIGPPSTFMTALLQFGLSSETQAS
jgi:CheY-like chemotaxis protein